MYHHFKRYICRRLKRLVITLRNAVKQYAEVKVNYNDIKTTLIAKTNQLNELQSKVKVLELNLKSSNEEEDKNSEVDKLKV